MIRFILVSVLSLVAVTNLQAQNLLTNPTFETDISGWDNPYSAQAAWQALDADGSSSSGSAILTNTLCNGGTSKMISQCLAVEEGDEYAFSGKIHETSGQNGTGRGVLWVDVYSTTNCTGTRVDYARSLEAGAPDIWWDAAASSTAPSGAKSIWAHLAVNCENGSTSYAASFDNTSLTITAGTANLPAAERTALEALFNATGGASWTVGTGWMGAAGTECSWFGVTCNTALTTVVGLDLHFNELVGTLPASIGDLTGLESLVLYSNSLSGPIPDSLGSLTGLKILYLNFNQISGSIPAALGSLSALTELSLAANRVGGGIPTELTALSNLTTLDLRANQLLGEIPAGLASIPTLTTFSVRLNGLWTNDGPLIALLAGTDAGWATTQTVPPTGVATQGPTSDSIVLSWTPIAYTADTGAYYVFVDPQKPGAALFSDGFDGGDTDWWPLGGSWSKTPDKTSTSLIVTGLEAGTTYSFTVRTVTEAGAIGRRILGNDNQVISEASATVQGTTAGP